MRKGAGSFCERGVVCHVGRAKGRAASPIAATCSGCGRLLASLSGYRAAIESHFDLAAILDNRQNWRFWMNITKVTASEFQQAFGALSDKARREPVVITKHGRDSLVVMSAEEWARLKR